MKDIIKTIIERTNWMKMFVGVVVLAVFAIISIFLLRYEIPHGNENVVHLLVGEILGIVGAVVFYYFGNIHKTDKKKDQETV